MSKKIYFTPGPSELYFTVEGHLRVAMREQIPSISHRSKQFKDIYQHAVTGLRELLSLPDDYQIFFTSSATEIWEHLLRNLVLNSSTHLVSGAFGQRFSDFSTQLGFTAHSVEAKEGTGAFLEALEFETPELVGLTLNESSTGVSFPENDLAQLRASYPDALIAADGVSSIPIPQIDYSQIDSAYFSVQKCFGLPAGLGVWLVGPRCFVKAEEVSAQRSIGTYRSLINLQKKGADFQTVETPNVLNLYLLGKVVEDMNNKGLAMIRRESKYKAAVLHQKIEDLDWLSPFVRDRQYQSETVVVTRCNKDTSEIVERLKDHGFVIGQGYGKYKTEHIRIANFPTHSKELVERLVDVLDTI